MFKGLIPHLDHHGNMQSIRRALGNTTAHSVLAIFATISTGACMEGSDLDVNVASSPLVTPDGQISDTVQVLAGNPGRDELYVAAPSGSVLTGVGATIATSSNNYASLIIEYRHINDDGTLGQRVLKSAGVNRPVDQLEVWNEVDDGDVLTGLGVNGKFDVKRMDYWSRTLDPATLRLSGPSRQKFWPPTAASLAPTVSFDSEQNGYDPERAVLLGVGLTATDGGTTHMYLDVGFLK